MIDVLNSALTDYGVKEIPGRGYNPKIVKYFEKKIRSDEVGWCCAFINYHSKKMGYEYSKDWIARSYLKLGYKVDTPCMGDLVIFWRESRNSWKGHIGFFINKGKGINVYGGNQDNMACIKSYPEHRLLGYRRLKKKVCKYL